MNAAGILKNILNHLKKTDDLYFAVKNTFKTDIKTVVGIMILNISISFVLIGIFAPTNNILHFIFQPLNSIIDLNFKNDIFSFAYSVFCGAISNFIFNFLILKYILKLLTTFTFIKYGGKTDDKKIM